MCRPFVDDDIRKYTENVSILYRYLYRYLYSLLTAFERCHQRLRVGAMMKIVQRFANQMIGLVAQQRQHSENEIHVILSYFSQIASSKLTCRRRTKTSCPRRAWSKTWSPQAAPQCSMDAATAARWPTAASCPHRSPCGP
jgi:hypothetical protein